MVLALPGQRDEQAPAQGEPGAPPRSNGLLSSGLAAYAARARAAQRATRTLDLQYYIWRDDLTGNLLAREVLHAAERGVHVRLLLDDMYAIGRERLLSTLDAHRHIEVRLFNATHWRRFGKAGFLLEMLFGGRHLNRRMHNKAWVADGRLAILGGRNVGDEYFDASDTFNFRDLDLAVAGPAANAAKAIFERYWYHRLSRPVCDVSRAPHDRRGGLRRLVRRLEQASALPAAGPFLAEVAGTIDCPPEGGRGPLRPSTLPTAAVRVVADPPGKAAGEGSPDEWLVRDVAALLEGARSEALLISPYFVPGPEGAAMLEALTARGVRVSVVTNSLAATDVVAVHGGYARYRKRLLRAGVALHELRPTGGEGTSMLGSRGASLHTKALVVDGARAFVGSFNLDPRSRALNTEMGSFVHEAGVARGVRDEHARLAGSDRSWRVGLDAAGGLRWEATVGGEKVTCRTEPDASLRRRALAWLARHAPLESQL